MSPVVQHIPLSPSGEESDSALILGPENAVLGLCLTQLLQANAEFPSHWFPLFLYGAPGCGKSLALQEVARRMCKDSVGNKTLYQTGPEFLTAFLHASETGTPFLEAFRELRCWCLDDLHPLRNKVAAQESLSSVIDFLVLQGTCVLFADRRLPSQEFSPRLVSRLRSGLSISVSRPEQKARQAILQALNEQSRGKSRIPQECLDLVAEQSTGDIRELTGAVNYLRHIAQGRELQPQDVADYFRQIRRADAIELKTIAKETARHHGVRVAELRGPSRQQHLVAARGFAMQMARELTGLSLQRIGAYFGRRDHTTVLNACRKTQEHLHHDPQTAQAWQEVRDRLVGS